MTPTLPVSEVFGPVWQGEGPHTGRVCSFVRLGLCNLACEWCDTPYTWDHTRFDVHAQCPPRSPEWIESELGGHGTDLLILSGGEPLIHQANPALAILLDSITHEVHVETNGTLIPSEWLRHRVEHFTVSPKLPMAGAHGGRPALVGSSLTAWALLANQGRAAWKIVVSSLYDVKLATSLMDSHDVPARQRWLMPEGVTADTILASARHLAPAILASGANLSLRQHCLLYGTERGR